MTQEFIYIDYAANKVECELSGIIVDDGAFQVIYLPSLDISGYGRNSEEAEEMVNDTIRYFLVDLIDQGPEFVAKELGKLGFLALSNAVSTYSRTIVNEQGEIEGLDIPEGATVRKQMITI